ncbi:hypothetical protein BCR44DRAFT_31256 [Catenaria anguillulae PL171]|uniref:Uncharacterized protein n=1 Tax=Catenaria anguillulae PL171 TaxID=765915 RepID=A0A1Y2HXQ7_9FUNG|nr:hypothetical protein BCR44DRAFT_31256 [Catenaria anguillulae PL171]
MTYPILPLTPAAFTVEVLNSATNDLMRLWRLEARIDTYLSVVSPARTRPQQPQSQFAAPSPPTLPTPAPAPSRITVVEVPTIHPVETATVPRGRGRKAAVAKKPRASAAKSSAASAASTSSLTTADNDTPTSPLSSLSASASSLGSPPPTSSGHSQHPLDVDLADHDVDLDFDCRVETIERLPTPIAAALTLGSTPNGSDMDKIKLYGILAASYLATSALYKVVQPCASVQEYFAQRFRLSRTQLARILHAAQVILDLSATPRDPVDLVPFPLSLDVACAVHKGGTARPGHVAIVRGRVAITRQSRHGCRRSGGG